MKDQPDIVARLRAYTQHNRPVLASDLKEAADEIERLRREARVSAMQLDNRCAMLDLLLQFAREVSDRVGRKVLPNLDRDGLDELVAQVAALRRDRDALIPADLPEAVEAPPAVTPSTERFDEIERRLALLESSVRTTMRRFSLAADAINAPGSEWAKLTRLSDALRGMSPSLLG